MAKRDYALSTWRESGVGGFNAHYFGGIGSNVEEILKMHKITIHLALGRDLL